MLRPPGVPQFTVGHGHLGGQMIKSTGKFYRIPKLQNQLHCIDCVPCNTEHAYDATNFQQHEAPCRLYRPQRAATRGSPGSASCLEISQSPEQDFNGLCVRKKEHESEKARGQLPAQLVLRKSVEDRNARGRK